MRRRTGAERAPRNGPRAGGGLGRASAQTGSVAVVAVVSGLGLEVALAAALGAGRESDAFFAAERLPLALAAIMMVVANQALVPTITSWLVAHGPARTWRLTTGLLLVVGGGAALLAGLLAALASPLMAVVAPGFTAEQQTLAADITRLMVLLIPLTATAEVLRSLVNSRGGHMGTAAMPLALSLPALAGVLLAIAADGPTPVFGVAAAFLVGGVCQLSFMVVLAFRRGFRPARVSLRDAELVAALRLCGRPTVGASLNPVARIAETAVASFLPAGTVSIVHYGNRLISAIGGTVFFRSVMVATLPRLTRAVAQERAGDALRITLQALRLLLAVSLPLTALVVALGQPAVLAVFRVGRLDEGQAALLGVALAVYGLSLPGSAVQRGLLAPFMARRNTKVPLRNTLYGVGANLLLLPALVLPLRGEQLAVVGVAAAYSASQYVHVAHARWRLRRDLGVDLRPLRPALLGWLAVAIAVGVAAAGVAAALDLSSATDRLVLLAGVVAAAGLALGVGACVVLLLRGPLGVRLRRRPRRRDKQAGGPDAGGLPAARDATTEDGRPDELVLDRGSGR